MRGGCLGVLVATSPVMLHRRRFPGEGRGPVEEQEKWPLPVFTSGTTTGAPAFAGEEVVLFSVFPRNYARQVQGDGESSRAYRHAMEDTLITALKWSISGSGIVAALRVSLDSGRRVIGWTFVLFVASSIALFAINIFGVYRSLIRKKANG